ncbi:Tumor necrosis factor receptor superfamily member 6, partial [Leptosomus discolor]
QCCKKCEQGFVKNVECPTNLAKHCVPCKNGKEYIDHANELDKCLRCSSCDSVFGLEVAKNCTPAQNTKCSCTKNHFCNSSVPCSHCYRCTICEHGIIEKQCTSTSDTVCGMKDVKCHEMCLSSYTRLAFYKTCLYSFLCCFSFQENIPLINTVRYKCQEHQFPFMLLDVDLSSHIAGIVEEMTLQEVKTFVRNHKVPEPVIDQIVRDYCSDTSEQKIKLFQVWYQRHGIKGAYGTLISSLREFKMCAASDKIEEKMKAAVSSHQEGGQSYNYDTELSKTCTEEGRNSYNDSAMLSKTDSGSLEET